MKWLITAARERPGPRRTAKMPQRLAAELIDAYNNQVSVCVSLLVYQHCLDFQSPLTYLKVTIIRGYQI